MQICHCTLNEFVEAEAGNGEIYCFGSGTVARWALNILEDRGMAGQVQAFADNAAGKTGTVLEHFNMEYPVISVDDMVKDIGKGIILVTNCYVDEVIKQLSGYEGLMETRVYIMYFLLAKQFEQVDYTGKIRLSERRQIPRVIHYCWFGGQKIPDEQKEYIKSWRRLCPDYEIVEWNESNYDYKKNAYMYEAYQEKKWGFVPDYARLDIIYEHGGIYLDTDVEAVRNLDDLLYQEAFAGFAATMQVNFGGGFGAVKQHPMIKELREYYDNRHFLRADGSCNMSTCDCYQAPVFKKYGMRYRNDLQMINGMTIYPQPVMDGFDPMTYTDYNKKGTYLKHRAAGSWRAAKQTEAAGNRVRLWNTLNGSDRVTYP